MLVTKSNSGKITFTRESWKEWFYIVISSTYIAYELEEGARIAPFYLPVYRREEMDAWVCFLTPIAPFVLILVAMKRGITSFWRDLVFTVHEWKKFEK